MQSSVQRGYPFDLLTEASVDLATSAGKLIDSDGVLWRSVVETTGQPPRMGWLWASRPLPGCRQRSFYLGCGPAFG